MGDRLIDFSIALVDRTIASVPYTVCIRENGMWTLYSIFRAFLPGNDSGRIIEPYVHLLPARGWTKFDSRLDDTPGRYCRENRRGEAEERRLNRVFASSSQCHKFPGKLESLVTMDARRKPVQGGKWKVSGNRDGSIANELEDRDPSRIPKVELSSATCFSNLFGNKWDSSRRSADWVDGKNVFAVSSREDGSQVGRDKFIIAGTPAVD